MKTDQHPVTSHPILEASGITFAFGRRPVLRDVSISAKAGEIIALLGPNGCGKSTLLRVLMGHLHGAGHVRWEGKDIRHWSAKELARKAAFLPQHPAYVTGQTVLEAIALGRYPHLGLLGFESSRDEQVAREAALAMGLQAELLRPVEALSGGQRQRVFLARCLAQEPAALLLDEPDTFLDLKHAALLAANLRRLATERNIAVILASHNLHFAAALAHRVLLMEDGQIITQGPPRTVLTPENITRTYGVDSIPWQQGETWGVGVVY